MISRNRRSIMKKIRVKDIYKAFIFLIFFLIFLIAGFFKRFLFLFSALFLILYIKIDRQKLRCSSCGSFLNLRNLYYGSKENYYCYNCGKLVEIYKDRLK